MAGVLPDDEYKKQYDDFNPSNYAVAMVTHFAREVDFFLENLHNFFTSVNLENGKCLEFGCGPTFHSILSASRKCSTILACEFVKQNREAVQKWMKDDADALDYGRFVATVVRLEGHEDPEAGAATVCNRLRSCLKAVYPCDALADKPVPSEVGDNFDVIISSLCLEAAAPTYEKFVIALEKIGRLSRLGGQFLLMGVLKQTFWYSGKDQYPSLYLTKESIHDAFVKAGFKDLQWSTLDGVSVQDTCDASGIFFVVATKS